MKFCKQFIYFTFTHTYTYIMWIFQGSVYFLFEFILTEYIVQPPQLKILGSATDFSSKKKKKKSKLFLVEKKKGFSTMYSFVLQQLQNIATFLPGAEACIMVGQNFEIFKKYIYNYFNIFKIQSTKIRVGPPKYLNQSNNALKKNNWSNSYRDITLFFAIIFFIVKCVLISVKYLIKFGIKHV